MKLMEETRLSRVWIKKDVSRDQSLAIFILESIVKVNL